MASLLILGAGGHGRVIYEIASSKPFYDRIEFLDDNSADAVGTFGEYKNFVGEFEYAFVAIGNIDLRKRLSNELKAAGFKIETLISSAAVVSTSARIGKGTVIEAGAIVNSNAVIGEGCIIAVGAIVDHDAQIGEYTQLDAGAICKSCCRVPSNTKTEAGQILSERK